MRNELLLQNLPLALAIVVAAWVWSRTGFRTPRVLRLAAPTPARLLAAFGWFLVAGVVLRSVGGQFGDGRVAIANSGQMYAYRAREPLLFWGQIIGEMVLVGGTGAALIFLGRRRPPALSGGGK
jgi:hypothetical protein